MTVLGQSDMILA